MIRIYGLLILLASLSAGGLFFYRSKNLVRKKSQRDLFFIYLSFWGLCGARAYHVLTDFWRYRDSLWEIFYFWRGGLGILGAITGGVWGLWLFSRHFNFNFWQMLDCLTPGLVLAQAIGRWANVFNQELLPFAWFEMATDFLIFFILIWGEKKFIIFSEGGLFALYLILYGSARFFLESFRSPRLMIFWGLSFTRGYCLLFVLSGLGFFFFHRSNWRKM